MQSAPGKALGVQSITSGRAPVPVLPASAHGSAQDRKRARVACIEENLSITMYQLIVKQLYHDGFTDAAHAVAVSTGCVVPDFEKRGARLEKLVANGLAVEASHAAELKAFHCTEVVEKYLSRAQLRVPAHMSAAQLKSSFAIGQMKERWASSSLGGPIACTDFSPDGSMIIVGGANKVGARIFTLDTLLASMNLSELRTDNDLSAAAERDTKQQPIGGAHTTTDSRASDATSLSQARHFTHHRISVETAKFHPTEALALTGGREGDVFLWSYHNPIDVETPTAILHDSYPIRKIDMSPTGSHALVATDHNVVRLCELESRTNLTLPSSVHSAALTDVSFRCDGCAFATSSFDGSFALSDVTSGKASLHVQKAHGGLPVTSVCYSRTGNILLTYGMDSCAKLWDLRRVGNTSSSAGGSTLMTIQTAAAPSTSTAVGGTAGAPSSNNVSVGTATTAVVPLQVESFGIPAKCEHRVKAKFNSHESLVLVQGSSLHEIQSFDVYSGAMVYTCAVGQSAQRAFAPHPYAPVLVSGGEDTRLRLWTLSTLPH